MASETSFKWPRSCLDGKMVLMGRDGESGGGGHRQEQMQNSQDFWHRESTDKHFQRRRRSRFPILSAMSPIVLLWLTREHLKGCMAFQDWQDGEEHNVLDHLPAVSFGTEIRQLQRQLFRGKPLPHSILDDLSNNSDLNFQIPKDIDVTSPPYPIQEHSNSTDNTDTNLLEEDGNNTRQTTGNPIINQELPIDFEMTLSVVQGTDYDLLVPDVKNFLEQYLEQQFQRVIDEQSDEHSLTSPIVRLQKVDLTVILVEFSSRRRTVKAGPIKPSLRRSKKYLATRNIQESSQLATMNVAGDIAYDVEVDGGSLTPEKVQQEWATVLAEIVSQPQLDEAITDGDVEGVLRVDQVSSPTLDQPEDTAALYSNSTSSGTDGEEAPWQDSRSVDENSTSDLTRPTTISIVFGFFLTGIAALGLVGYCYFFYRKRKKRLRKKKQMKESIPFPSRSVTTSPSQSNLNGSMASRKPASSSFQAVASATPMVASPMILLPADDSFSEDTSYKGLESSIASEDASDAFAKELKRAASLDQHAWDEFQRRKEALDKNQTATSLTLKKSATTGKEDTKNVENAKALPLSLLGKRDLSSDDEGIVGADAIEADVQGKTSRALSYPYGDERAREQDADDDWVENPMTPRSSRYQVPGQQWEPYNSGLPPSPEPGITEEKKDEISPTAYFTKELHNIEKDLARYGVKDGAGTRGIGGTTISSADDLSTVDVVSEVEELSKYVRRYEQRKDRRNKRDMEVHERFSMNGASSPATSSMSISMDGRVYNPHHHDSAYLEPSTPSSASTMSSLPRPPAGSERGSDLSSYSGSYLNVEKRNATNRGLLSFVSDDESAASEEQEEVLRNQRLGISPFRVSPPDDGYYSSYSKGEKSASTGTGTGTTRAATVPSSPDDYRRSVGYGYDGGSSNNGETADPSFSSRSSVNLTTRLSNLRANKAIIDSSSSDVHNPHNNYSTSTESALDTAASSENTNWTSNNNANNARQAVRKKQKTSNNRFERLRGMFEQKTTEQPAPIYPPGEHWQYEGHRKASRGTMS